MKRSLLLSLSLHLVFFSFIAKVGQPRRSWEGYPSVLPVDLVVMPVGAGAAEQSAAGATAVEVKPSPPEPSTDRGVTATEVTRKKSEEERRPKPVPVPEPVKGDPSHSGRPGSTGGFGSGGGLSVPGSPPGVRLDVSNFPFAYYLSAIVNRIRAYWAAPQAQEARATVYFKIGREGRVSDVKLEASSGNYLFDESAMRAVKLASPLPPLPLDFLDDELGVHLEFESAW